MKKRLTARVKSEVGLGTSKSVVLTSYYSPKTMLRPFQNFYPLQNSPGSLLPAFQSHIFALVDDALVIEELVLHLTVVCSWPNLDEMQAGRTCRVSTELPTELPTKLPTKLPIELPIEHPSCFKIRVGRAHKTGQTVLQTILPTWLPTMLRIAAHSRINLIPTEHQIWPYQTLSMAPIQRLPLRLT